MLFIHSRLFSIKPVFQVIMYYKYNSKAKQSLKNNRNLFLTTIYCINAYAINN